MALCVMNPHMEIGDTKINKCAVKLLGIDHFEVTDEEILDSISKYIEPTSIEALLFDTFNNFYVLFLKDIDSTCRLVGRRIQLRSKCMSVFPLLDCYVVDNVYPCLRNEELRDIFRTFGNVFTVSNHHIVPNSTKFSHVLSGKREITFLLPASEAEVYMPVNVVHPPYSFHVRKICCGCLTEGHSVLHCPDIEDDQDWPKLEKDSFDSESDGELEALIKSENIDIFEDKKVQDCPRDIQTTGDTSKEVEEPSRDISVSETKKDDEIKQDGIVQADPEEEKLPKKINNSDVLTEVVSTATVSRFTTGPLPPFQRVVKKSFFILPPLAEELINETCGTFIIEANVMKQLVKIDGRLRGDIVKFASNYLDEFSTLIKFIRKVCKQCRTDKKYSSLAGPFTQKLKRLQTILSGISKA